MNGKCILVMLAVSALLASSGPGRPADPDKAGRAGGALRQALSEAEDPTAAGKAYVYYPRAERDRVFRRLAGGFLDQVFDGALGEYVARALQSKRPSVQELEGLEQMIAAAKHEAQKRGETKKGGAR